MFSEKHPVQNYLRPIYLQDAFDGIIHIRNSNRAIPTKSIDIKFDF
jgi:hypothetical protein